MRYSPWLIATYALALGGLDPVCVLVGGLGLKEIGLALLMLIAGVQWSFHIQQHPIWCLKAILVDVIPLLEVV